MTTRDEVIIELLIVIVRGLQNIITTRRNPDESLNIAYNRYADSTIKMAKEYLGNE